MVAARGSAPRRRRPPRARSAVALLRELARRASVSYLRLEKGDDVVVWRRAA